MLVPTHLVALELEGPDPICDELQFEAQVRNGDLLDPKLGKREGVDVVFAMQCERYFATHRKVEVPLDYHSCRVARRVGYGMIPLEFVTRDRDLDWHGRWRRSRFLAASQDAGAENWGLAAPGRPPATSGHALLVRGKERGRGGPVD